MGGRGENFLRMYLRLLVKDSDLSIQLMQLFICRLIFSLLKSCLEKSV